MDDELTLSGLLFPEEFGGRDEYEQIAGTLLTGKPVMMVGFGVATAGRVFGQVVIEEISDGQDYIGPDGAGQRLSFDILVSPYGADGGQYGGFI